MEEIVARLNIDHYRKALAKDGDKTKHRTILQLLAEEEAKLAAIENVAGRQQCDGTERPEP